MASKMKVVFELNSSQAPGNKIKLVVMHPLKRWVGIINQNNTFSLWNFEEKILIKSFSCNTLDDTPLMKGPVEVREIVFFDRHSLTESCGNAGEKIQVEGIGRAWGIKNHIIFVTAQKLIFYDYVTDVIKPINEKDFQQKGIRKVCVYSRDKICIAMGDGSFKVLDIRDQSMKNSMSIRNIKGFHVKPITWIFAYSQNTNEMPKLITASGQDGLMACWNVDMILKTNPPSSGHEQQHAPCFKFTSSAKSSKGGSQNLLQQIISLQYDPASYRLITVSEQHIRLWSTMTGMQVKRIKNSFNHKQIIFFNHFSYISETFLAYAGGTKIAVIHNASGVTERIGEIDPRGLSSAASQQQMTQIHRIKSLPHHPSHIYIYTNTNMMIVQIDKFYPAAFGTHPTFLTQLSTINSREYINKSEGQIRKDITNRDVSAIRHKFQEDILINTFYLSMEGDWIWFNLLEIQYSTMLHQTRKYKMKKIDQISCLKQATGGRSITMVNFDGSQIIVFNKSIRYYELYGVGSFNQEEDDLIGVNKLDDSYNKRIDFYSKLRLMGSGYCRDIVWHQYKNQFAVICGFDKDRLVEYKVTKEKKGIFKSGKDGQIKIGFNGAEPTSYRACIYQKFPEGYKMIEKSDPYQSDTSKIFCFGSFFAYSYGKSPSQKLAIISEKSSVREIQGVLSSPEQVYVSYCQSFYILAYDRYFIIHKVQENGSMAYLRTVEHSIMHGYFWQKFFFFLTENCLYFLHILDTDILLIKLAQNSTNSIFSLSISSNIDPNFEDDFQMQCLLLPPGQQQIAGIANMNVILLNQSGHAVLISLQKFPYVVFCLEIASGVLDRSVQLYEKASLGIKWYMKKALGSYGMITPDLLQ